VTTKLRAPSRLPVASLWAVLMVAVLVLAGCGADDEPVASNPGGAVYEPPQDTDGFRGAGLLQLYRMPDVTLTDTSGSPYNLRSDTRRPVTLVFFGYTNCPDVCNLVMADLASALTRLEPALLGKVQPLFVTTDPARDTAAVLGEYVNRFHPAFEGLTGTLPQVKSAATPLGVPIEGMNRLPSGGYEVGHGTQVIGFTADDKARVVWTDGTPVEDLVADIHTLAEYPG
jgi:protein SCO1